MTDQQYMQMALEEGKKGLGLTSPNPAVGAVIVKDGVVLGKGWHRKAGEPHAEREAIADAMKTHGADLLKGATIYVTLEPCSTTGKTPPCCMGVIEAGISKVVYGAEDPNPAHVGAADKLLRDHGVEVVSGVEREECEALLRSFAKRITTGLPWVIAKTAMSLDGRITRPKQEGQWLTGEQARAEVHRIRGEVDAVIVGGKTVRKDDPKLTVRSDDVSPEKAQPWRVVLTQSGKESLPQDACLFTDEYKDRTVVYEDEALEQVLRNVAELGCNSVLLECGGVLMRQFLEQGLVDEVALFYAPILTGGSDFGFGLGDHLSESQVLSEPKVKTFGSDVMVRGVLAKRD